MNFNKTERIPPDILESNSSGKKPENENISDVLEQEQEVRSLLDEEKQTEDQPGTALEKFQPTLENPIKSVAIGLHHTFGSFEYPTRIVVTLKNGRIGDMPWKEAELFLSPEFRIAREIGERARRIERETNDLMNSIRKETDVMKSSGHLKDNLLKPLGRERPALKYLNIAGNLVGKIDEIAQQSFLELRRMVKDGRINETNNDRIKKLYTSLDLCQSELDEVRKKAFQNLPRVQETYENVFQKSRREWESLENSTYPELPEPE